MKIVQKAKLVRPAKPPYEQEVSLDLYQLESKCFRWAISSGGNPPCDEPPDYLSKDDAVAGLRAIVDSTPSMVGFDLTILSSDPTPSERAAEAIHDEINILRELGLPASDLAGIIDRETNVSGVISSSETLIAYLFRHRAAFSAALFLIQNYGAALRRLVPANVPIPERDLVMDGLILEVIESIEKAKHESYEKLKAPLMQPISQIVTASRTPKGPVN